MTSKEIAKRDFQQAIERAKQEPTLQNILAMDRLAYHYLLIVENEQQIKAFEQAQKARVA